MTTLLQAFKNWLCPSAKSLGIEGMTAGEIVEAMKPQESPLLSLAERLFAARANEDTLFREVNRILGCDIENCLDDDFEFATNDTFWDDYDNSVELVLRGATPAVTDEQARQILGLGFGQAYISHNGVMTQIHVLTSGEVHRWSPDAAYMEGYVRTGDEDNQWRAKCNVLTERLKELKGRPNP